MTWKRLKLVSKSRDSVIPIDRVYDVMCDGSLSHRPAILSDVENGLQYLTSAPVTVKNDGDMTLIQTRNTLYTFEEATE